MNVLDHLFVILITVIMPVAGFISYRRLLRRAAKGENVDRNQLYLHTCIGQWVLLALLVAGWLFAARPWSAIGFELVADAKLAIGVVLTLVAIGLLVLQVRQAIVADKAKLDKIKLSFGETTIIVPRNGNELARFYGLSLTAGIVEEILWRGFLFWYLGQFMPLWVAAIISTVSFGIAHAYQGLSQVPSIMLVGAILSGLYLLTGSIWLPILLHVAMDVLQGRLGYEVMRRSDFDDRNFPDADSLAIT